MVGLHSRRLLWLGLFLLSADVGAAEPRYVSVVFHDIADRPSPTDPYAVSTGGLIGFFEWLRGNDWTVITLDDIARAKSGERALPERAILMTFDDGYRSLYTRVYPLLMAYRIPVVAPLIVSLLEDRGASREEVITWTEAREMARSGLVEFASHSYELHRYQRGNPLGSGLPTGAARLWSESAGYEDENAYRKRIREDLVRSRVVMEKELGRSPRALAWPYGRYSRRSQEEALGAKFEFLLSLDPWPGVPGELPVVPRVMPLGDPNLQRLVNELLYGPENPSSVRLLRVDPVLLPWREPGAMEAALRRIVERAKALRVNRLVVEAGAYGSSGKLEGTWFPTRGLPVRADILSWIVWQLRTQSGAQVAISLPVRELSAAVGGDAAVRVYDDLAVAVLADAILLEHVPGLASIPFGSPDEMQRLAIRRRRQSLDLSRLPADEALAMRCFAAFEDVRPGTRLYILADSAGKTPSGVADLTLVRATSAPGAFRQQVSRLKSLGWFEPGVRSYGGLWIAEAKPPSPAHLKAAAYAFERAGGVAFGCAADILADAGLAPFPASPASTGQF